MTLGLATEPVSLDPAAGLYIAERFILMSLFDTLITMAPDGSLHPGLATAWESNDDATEFTFTLRDGVHLPRRHAFRRLSCEDRLRSHPGDLTDFSSAQAAMANYVGTEVVDDQTVTVTFDASKPRFLEDLSQPWLGIPSPTAAADEGFAQNPVGSGPFVFEGMGSAGSYHVGAQSRLRMGARICHEYRAGRVDEVVLPLPAGTGQPL